MENVQKQVAALKSSKNRGDRRRGPRLETKNNNTGGRKKGRLNIKIKEKTWNLRGRII
jgi:hypothetical protein